MVSDNLIRGLAQPTNHVAQAYEARTAQINQQREAEQQKKLAAEKQRDQDMQTVFDYAGDGYIDEARYYAQQKGLQVPDAIFQNADMAKGLSLSGKLYGDDVEKAQKFSLAWMQTSGNPDINARVMAAQQVAGIPMNSEDRQLQRQIALEQWKIKNRVGTENGGFTLGAGDIRYDREGNVLARGAPKDDNGEYEAYAKAYNAAISSGLMEQAEAHAAGEQAAEQYRIFKQRQSGLMSPPPTAPQPTNTAMQPPYPGAKMAPDGKWYVQNADGQYLLVE